MDPIPILTPKISSGESFYLLGTSAHAQISKRPTRSALVILAASILNSRPVSLGAPCVIIWDPYSGGGLVEEEHQADQPSDRGRSRRRFESRSTCYLFPRVDQAGVVNGASTRGVARSWDGDLFQDCYGFYLYQESELSQGGVADERAGWRVFARDDLRARLPDQGYLLRLRRVGVQLYDVLERGSLRPQ